MIDDESCVYCGIKITEESVIYVRVKVNEKWGSYPCCTKCWYEKNPDRMPHRLKIKALKEK